MKSVKGHGVADTMIKCKMKQLKGFELQAFQLLYSALSCSSFATAAFDTILPFELHFPLSCYGSFIDMNINLLVIILVDTAVDIMFRNRVYKLIDSVIFLCLRVF